MSLWNVGASLGIAVGFALGGIVADHFGWRWAFYLTVGPGLICTFLAWRMREPQRGASEAPVHGHLHGMPQQETGEGGPSLDAYTGASSRGAAVPPPYPVVIRSILRIPTMRVAIAAQTLNFFVLGAAAFWFPTMLTRRFTDLSLSKAGLISGAVLVLAGIVGTLGGGWLADRLITRLPNARLLVTAVAFLISAPVLFLSLQVSTLGLFLPLFFLGGVFLQAYNGPLSALMQDVAPPPLRAASVALSLIIAHVLGDAFAPALLGGLSDVLGRDTAGHGLLVSAMRFTLAPVILAAGLVALLGLRHVVPDMQAMQDGWHKGEIVPVITV
jgi:MFS family permease